MKRFRAISKSYTVSAVVHLGLIVVAVASYDPSETTLYSDEMRDRLFITTMEKTPPAQVFVKSPPPPPVVRAVKPPVKKKPKKVTKTKKTVDEKAPEPKAEKPPSTKETPKRSKRAVVRKAVPKAIGARVDGAPARDVARKSAPPVTAEGPVGESVKSPDAKVVPRDQVVKLERSYYGTLSSYLRKNYAYPRRARVARVQGIVLIEIVIDADGNILRRKIVRSSGSDILDEAALASIRGINAVPAPPSGLTWRKRAVRVPFRYQLRT